MTGKKNRSDLRLSIFHTDKNTAIMTLTRRKWQARIRNLKGKSSMVTDAAQTGGKKRRTTEDSCFPASCKEGREKRYLGRGDEHPLGEEAIHHFRSIPLPISSYCFLKIKGKGYHFITTREQEKAIEMLQIKQA